MIFIKVFQNLAQYSGKVPISHWVSRIAVNTCRNQMMAEKARPELRHADLSEEQAAMLENLAASEESLPPIETRRARSGGKVACHAKTGWSAWLSICFISKNAAWPKIQKVTGWTAATIKVRAFRARQKLRKQIGGLL